MKLSYVIVAHDEGIMLRTAALSVITAAQDSRLAVQWGAHTPLTLQLLIVLDNADEATRRFAETIESEFHTKAMQDWSEVKVVHSSFGEPGSARNVGVSMATGDIVGILDGDDLVGKSFVKGALLRFVEISRTQPLTDDMVVLHPEHLLYFGTKTLVWRQPSYEEYQHNKAALLHTNLWDITLIAPRNVLAKHPFVAARAAEGAGYEDWEWSLSSSLEGIHHDIISDTFCYKRSKRVSRFTRDNFFSVLIPTIRVDVAKVGRHLA